MQGRILLKSYIRIAERAALMTIGTALCIMALVLIALGVTWLAVIGILLSLPGMGFAFNVSGPANGRSLPKRQSTPKARDPICWRHRTLDQPYLQTFSTEYLLFPGADTRSTACSLPASGQWDTDPGTIGL